MIEYTLIRSKRKTLGIYVRPEGLEVRAPFGMDQREIQRIVESKAPWISDKTQALQAHLNSRKTFQLEYGSTVPYRGRPCTLVPKEGGRVGFEKECFYMPSSLDAGQRKEVCIQIYRLLAKQDLTERVQHFAPYVNRQPKSIKINGAKTHWGSCSNQGSLNFSWRLILLEDDLIDYVVVHELAHLWEMNHSPKFWRLVAKILPDYQTRKLRLREAQMQLVRENWYE